MGFLVYEPPRGIGIISLDAHPQLVSGGILHYAATHQEEWFWPCIQLEDPVTLKIKFDDKYNGTMIKYTGFC